MSCKFLDIITSLLSILSTYFHFCILNSSRQRDQGDWTLRPANHFISCSVDSRKCCLPHRKVFISTIIFIYKTLQTDDPDFPSKHNNRWNMTSERDSIKAPLQCRLFGPRISSWQDSFQFVPSQSDITSFHLVHGFCRKRLYKTQTCL